MVASFPVLLSAVSAYLRFSICMQEVKKMTTVAVLQSNYLPWKGYFDIIHDVDIFVFYDGVQYTKNDWRNRNKIKTSAGPAWMTVPVGPSNSRLIHDVTIVNDRWQKKHWKQIVQNYCKAPYFNDYRSLLEPVYLNSRWTSLSTLNQYLIRLISNECLGIEVEFRDSREYSLIGQKQTRLLNLLRQTGADSYVSGPAARAYIEEQEFESVGIELIWKSYSDYPEYPQFHPPFCHGVSVLDLLFQMGSRAGECIWGQRAEFHPKANL